VEFCHCVDSERCRVCGWVFRHLQQMGKFGYDGCFDCKSIFTIRTHTHTHTHMLSSILISPQAQTIFILAAAATATSVYIVLVGVFESVLKPYNIKATMGKQMLSVVWLAVAFGLASGFFWLASVCCCSGKSAHKKVSVEKTPYTYERVASPAFPAHQGQHTGYVGAGHGQSGTAYEPFRGNHV
jgi:hypothetical protein